MSAILEENTSPFQARSATPVVVVGTGPVGVRFTEELRRRKPDAAVVIYGNETWEADNRVRLAGLLTGELNLSGLQTSLTLPHDHRVLAQHNGEYDRHGGEQRYSTVHLHERLT